MEHRVEAMPLERFELDAVREGDGFSFLMRTIKTMQTVRVFVMDEALQGGVSISSRGSLSAQFEADRTALEAVAREKYKRGQVTDSDVIVITLDDMVRFPISRGVSLYAAKNQGCPKTTSP